MRFAARSDFGRGSSDFHRSLDSARAQGRLVDLTVSNPTRCGFLQPAEMLRPLLDTAALQYEPDPLGLRIARQAVGQMYRERWRAEINPEDILLTASTSEAYSYLLRLFCEPGEAVLVPSPSYPLFDLLARLHDVELISYPLVYHDGWQIDPASLRSMITDRVRAIIVIHPNNPTGHYCSPADRHLLLQCAQQHNLPLIVDEVFLDYALDGNEPSSFASANWNEIQPADVVTFVLGGLSKLLCMPQMKVAWMGVCGAPEQRAVVMERLEVIADTFLSVGSPAQLALPVWLQERHNIQQAVLARVERNLRTLDLLLVNTVVSRLRVDGGWAAVLRVPATEADTSVAVRLLDQFSVAVHPGSFYGFPASGWLVISLLVPPDIFMNGIQRLLDSF